MSNPVSIDDHGRMHVVVDEMPDAKRPPVDVYRSTFRTIQLTATKQVASLIDGPDPTRVSVVIIAIDAPVILGDKSQISDTGNVTTGTPNPVGAMIPINVAVQVPTQTEISVATPLTGVNVNRISVITTHKVSS